MDYHYDSKDIAACAVTLSVSKNQSEEDRLKKEYRDKDILCCAVNFGGEFISSIMKIIERAVVCAKREGVIDHSHVEEGSVAGATREALAQIMPKAIGLNGGGKIAVARYKDHISVAVFFGIGLLHLNEIAIGLGHRVLDVRSSAINENIQNSD